MDQGIGCPTIMATPPPPEPIPPKRQEMAGILAALGFSLQSCLGALKASNDDADVAMARLASGEEFSHGVQQPDASTTFEDDEDPADEELSAFRFFSGRGNPGRRQQEPKSKIPEIVDSIQFNGVIYNRHFDHYADAPHFGLIHESEYWIGDILGPVLLAIYPEDPEERKIKHKVLLPAEPSGVLKPNAPFARLMALVDPRKADATWKEILVWKDRKVVHVFNLVSHGRKMYRSLVYSSDNRLALHSLPPNTNDRSTAVPPCVATEGGDFKRKVVHEASLVISRANVDIGGHEIYVPARLLQGLIPSSLLEAFRIWLKKIPFIPHPNQKQRNTR